MDWFLLQIADFLQELSDAIRTAVAEENFFDKWDGLGIVLLIGWVIYAAGRTLYRWITRHDEKKHEKFREAEAEVKTVKKEIAEVRARNDQLLKYDPERFLTEMKRIKREKVLSRLES